VRVEDKKSRRNRDFAVFCCFLKLFYVYFYNANYFLSYGDVVKLDRAVIRDEAPLRLAS